MSARRLVLVLLAAACTSTPAPAPLQLLPRETFDVEIVGKRRPPAAVDEIHAHCVLPAQVRRDDQPAVWKHGDGMKIDLGLWRDGRDTHRRAARFTLPP